MFHLVFTSDYQRPETVPLGNPTDWQWLGPIIWRALETCPSVVLSQFLIAANALEVRGGEQIRYQFNEPLLDSWFGERKTELFHRIAAWEPQVELLDPNAQAYVWAGQLEAKKRIAEVPK